MRGLTRISLDPAKETVWVSAVWLGVNMSETASCGTSEAEVETALGSILVAGALHLETLVGVSGSK